MLLVLTKGLGPERLARATGHGTRIGATVLLGCIGGVVGGITNGLGYRARFLQRGKRRYEFEAGGVDHGI